LLITTFGVVVGGVVVGVVGGVGVVIVFRCSLVGMCIRNTMECRRTMRKADISPLELS
jgi:uncharacterized protein (DUF2062 family)